MPPYEENVLGMHRACPAAISNVGTYISCVPNIFPGAQVQPQSVLGWARRLVTGEVHFFVVTCRNVHTFVRVYPSSLPRSIKRILSVEHLITKSGRESSSASSTIGRNVKGKSSHSKVMLVATCFGHLAERRRGSRHVLLDGKQGGDDKITVRENLCQNQPPAELISDTINATLW